MKSTWPLITTVTLSAALLVGCSGGDSDPEDAEASSRTAPATASAGEAAPGDSHQVLAKQEYELPGTNDQVTVGIKSLVVDGDTMKLTLVLTPEFSSLGETDQVSISKITDPWYLSPRLIDREHHKEYSIVSDTFNKRWQVDTMSNTTNGEPIIWWGIYAAPEDGIDSVDLRIFGDMPDFTNVPIQQ
ncbi:hypothetical protein [Arthrobacter sp. 179]|uniref:hypothetical protein n=1 Tax=Arthrobacter sp. 179 TaxID=3457734 RepID=UPI004034308D